MNRSLVVPEQATPFALLHRQQRASRAWWQGALCAGALYGGLLLTALCWPAQRVAPVLAPPDELTVTLLDLPQPAAVQPASKPTPDLDEPPPTGAASRGGQVARPSSKSRVRPVEAKLVEPKSDEPDEPKAAEPKAAEPKAVEPAIAATLPSPAKAEPTTAAPAATPGTMGAQGASGSGAGGAGNGSGAGTAGAAGGKTGGALPFIDGMTRPGLLSKVDPIYSREALAAGVEGLVLTKCVISTRGELQQCKIVKSLQFMDAAVLKALAQWRYTPVVYQGRPTAVEYVIPVRVVKP